MQPGAVRSQSKVAGADSRQTSAMFRITSSKAGSSAKQVVSDCIAIHLRLLADVHV